MFSSCLPTTVKSCQIMWSDASTQLLSPHSTPGQSHFLNGCWCQPAIQVTCLYCWEHEESHNAIWLLQQLNTISITSSHNQQAHYSVLWARPARNPCNSWELQHCVYQWTRIIQQFYPSQQVKIPPLKQGGSHCHEVLPLPYSGENSILKMPLLLCCTVFSMIYCKQHFSLFDFK